MTYIKPKSVAESQKLRMQGIPYIVDQSVYVASIAENPNILKVGCSMYPDDRMKQLSNYYGLTFKLEMTLDHALESVIHSQLSDFLYQGHVSDKRKTGREFFECTLDDVIEAYEYIYGHLL